ncbi:hypothetical protein BO70DRAFT_396873 [Aspergillus heteromorphus CBS 117.55]|uniref:Uncharacterized protein n=1 Tax=Aspergillus heteromorphus CBS 117.55 TaxID=1448321 RepID=A0A317W6E4_9EURO|nr:uncharacterized protein BO70DRAFT_396873 [Aspergillus heteromorphus CBS 117.55]PWY80578.1 hypothetical protein BO70DRAFT_396873 [Aspergillus heteromorphus CBS 117.55]
MIALAQQTPDVEDQLLRSELCTIVAIMNYRIKGKEYQDPITCPIMVLSFKGDRQGRILQARFDPKKRTLVMRKLYG